MNHKRAQKYVLKRTSIMHKKGLACVIIASPAWQVPNGDSVESCVTVSAAKKILGKMRLILLLGLTTPDLDEVQ